MANAKFQGIAIRGIAAAVPEHVVFNDEIGSLTDRAYVSELSQRLGVNQRRKAGALMSGSRLAAEAVRSVLNLVGWESNSIDLLILGTQTPDQTFPGNAFHLHKSLGLSKNCVVFDFSLGCSAFTHGLWIVSSLLQASGRRGVLVNVDLMTKTLFSHDIGNQILFGDAATATAIEMSDGCSPMYISLASDGTGIESVCFLNSGVSRKENEDSGFVLNGPAVLGLALRDVPRLVKRVLEKAGVEVEDVDLFVPHQANAFILRKLAQAVKIPEDKLVLALEKFGNTSSASIPLALCHSLSKVSTEEMKVVLTVGFGTGFSLSAAVVDLSQTRFAEVAPVA